MGADSPFLRVQHGVAKGPRRAGWTGMFKVILFLCAAGIVCGDVAKYEPGWARVQPQRTIALTPAATDSPSARGEALVKTVAALQPGDCLTLAGGTYSVARMWDVQVSGTEQAPVWITAEKGATPVITRPDARQNTMNVGQGKPVEFLCLRGLEITGGSHGVRLGKCRHVWVDQCHIHHTGNVCLSANSQDTSRLYITRNHIHHGNGHAEGLYLGGNDGTVIMSESIIALNHIHDCYGEQGDGIEVKQGSWGNLIAENDVHDTNYPCITVYGTAGKPRNIIERNLCRNSRDNVMQVQGEAIVRNNILINGASAGFSSTDHQGKTLNLEVVHNTIVNTGHAFRGGSWNGREGMILANNILCSKNGDALYFPNGSTGLTITGNVTTGGGPKQGCTPGNGLADFAALTWDAQKHDATPAAAAKLDHADPKHLLPEDFHGNPRGARTTAGAVIAVPAR
jgi:hypothetical protein